MPAELRQIIFRRDEVSAALSAGGAAKALALPPGDIAMVRIDGSADGPVAVKIVPPDGGEAQTVRVSSDRLAGALVAWCRDTGIPVPKGARKSLLSMGDNVVLSLAIDAREDALPDFVEVA